MIVAGLVVLAVVASLFLIFSDSVQVLRIGLVAALWAAVIGAIAMTKYRRESAADKAKIRDLQTVYELQLEREVSARREYEIGVEARVRSEVAVDVSEMAALRAELAALRGSLEVLFDGRLPVDRVAIAADGTRIGELGAGPAARPPVPFAPQPAYFSSGPTFASPDDEPVTAEVSVVPGEPDGKTPEAEATPNWVGRGGAAPGLDDQATAKPKTPAAPSVKADGAKTTPTAAKPEAAKTEVVKPEATKTAAVKPEAAKTEAVKPGAAKITPATPETAPAPAADAPPPAGPGDAAAPRRSRRRADDEDEAGQGAHSNGLTVAEIIANMKATNGDSGGARSGRRRRD